MIEITITDRDTGETVSLQPDADGIYYIPGRRNWSIPRLYCGLIQYTTPNRDFPFEIGTTDRYEHLRLEQI